MSPSFHAAGKTDTLPKLRGRSINSSAEATVQYCSTGQPAECTGAVPLYRRYEGKGTAQRWLSMYSIPMPSFSSAEVSRGSSVCRHSRIMTKSTQEIK